MSFTLNEALTTINQLTGMQTHQSIFTRNANTCKKALKSAIRSLSTTLPRTLPLKQNVLSGQKSYIFGETTALITPIETYTPSEFYTIRNGSLHLSTNYLLLSTMLISKDQGEGAYTSSLMKSNDEINYSKIPDYINDLILYKAALNYARLLNIEIDFDIKAAIYQYTEQCVSFQKNLTGDHTYYNSGI